MCPHRKREERENEITVDINRVRNPVKSRQTASQLRSKLSKLQIESLNRVFKEEGAAGNSIATQVADCIANLTCVMLLHSRSDAQTERHAQYLV